MILKAFDFWRIVPSRSAGDFPIENSPAASWTRPVGLAARGKRVHERDFNSTYIGTTV